MKGKVAEQQSVVGAKSKDADLALSAAPAVRSVRNGESNQSSILIL